MQLARGWCVLLLAALLGSCGPGSPAGDKNGPGAPGKPEAKKTKKSGSSSPGVKVGEKAPPLELKDQNGKVRKLSELLRLGNVALVFYRSADW